jgi:hypothetical protein
MGTRGSHTFMSQKNMFQISAQSIEAIQSYCSTSAGYQNWVLIEVRENDLECFLKFNSII